MRVRVTADHNHVPPDEPRLAVAFKAGTEVTTRREWGEALIAAGKGEEIDPPKREADADGR